MLLLTDTRLHTSPSPALLVLYLFHSASTEESGASLDGLWPNRLEKKLGAGAALLLDAAIAASRPAGLCQGVYGLLKACSATWSLRESFLYAPITLRLPAAQSACQVLAVSVCEPGRTAMVGKLSVASSSKVSPSRSAGRSRARLDSRWNFVISLLY